MDKPDIQEEQPDFSLVLGGPLFQLWRRVRLSGDGLELVRRRVFVYAILAWLPLLVLSMIDGHVLGSSIQVPFLYDIEAHVRFLIALPILIAADLIVHSRIRPVVRRFVQRRIISPEDLPEFDAAIDSAMRLRNSVTVEVVLLVFVYTLGLWVWRSSIATGAASWYATGDGSQLHFTLAGYWYAFVSVPIFQFLLVRWYLRFFIWFRFLFRVSKLGLLLYPTHPDKTGGIGFLGHSTYAFAPILFAQGALLSGLIANKVLYEGHSLNVFKLEAGGFIAFFVFFVLCPLLVFTPQLARAKRRGLHIYGELASRYVRGFEEKWVTGSDINDDELLGTGDIQSLADLGNSYAVVKEMRIVAFDLKDLLRLAMATAAPLLPLMLTVLSLEQLLAGLLKILF